MVDFEINKLSSKLDSLFEPSKFCAVSELECRKVAELSRGGFYSIKLNVDVKLPDLYQCSLLPHRIIYIGVASKSLYRRFWQQELNGIGYGTFFRSVAAMLSYRPIWGSLANRINKYNYTFSPKDKASVVRWMQENLLVNCLNYCDFTAEKGLINFYTPLLNIAHNPKPLAILMTDRAQCRAIANKNI